MPLDDLRAINQAPRQGQSLEDSLPDEEVLLWTAKGGLPPRKWLQMGINVLVALGFAAIGGSILAVLIHSAVRAYPYYWVLIPASLAGLILLRLFWAVPIEIYNQELCPQWLHLRTQYGASATHFYIKKPHQELQPFPFQEFSLLDGRRDQYGLLQLSGTYFHPKKGVFRVQDIHHPDQNALSYLLELYKEAPPLPAHS